MLCINVIFSVSNSKDIAAILLFFRTVHKHKHFLRKKIMPNYPCRKYLLKNNGTMIN